jgi:hypothetical protein
MQVEMQTKLLLHGLRTWGDRMALTTIRDESLTEAMRDFVINQELELACICAKELIRRIKPTER